MADTIVIKGLDKLQRKLGNIKPAVVRGIKAGTLHVKGKIDQYPAATQANQPKQYSKGQWNTWYERGWGSKWALAGGGWHGVKSSETLGRKWTTKTENNGLTGVVGNNVSYGPYVQGGDSAPHKQAAAMKRIGWKTTDEVIDQEAQAVTDFIKSEIEKEISK